MSLTALPPEIHLSILEAVARTTDSIPSLHSLITAFKPCAKVYFDPRWHTKLLRIAVESYLGNAFDVVVAITRSEALESEVRKRVEDQDRVWGAYGADVDEKKVKEEETAWKEYVEQQWGKALEKPSPKEYISTSDLKALYKMYHRMLAASLYFWHRGRYSTLRRGLRIVDVSFAEVTPASLASYHSYIPSATFIPRNNGPDASHFAELASFLIARSYTRTSFYVRPEEFDEERAREEQARRVAVDILDWTPYALCKAEGEERSLARMEVAINIAAEIARRWEIARVDSVMKAAFHADVIAFGQEYARWTRSNSRFFSYLVRDLRFNEIYEYLVLKSASERKDWFKRQCKRYEEEDIFWPGTRGGEMRGFSAPLALLGISYLLAGGLTFFL